MRSWSIFVLLVSGCASDSGFHRNDAEDVFWQEPSHAVDILFVVDDSISMSDVQQSVAQGFHRFVSAIEAEDLDFQLGVTTTNTDSDWGERGRLLGTPPFLTPGPDTTTLFMDRVQVGVDGSDKEQGLEAALLATGTDLNG